MRRTAIACFFLLSAALPVARNAFGDDPAWKSKPITQWSEEDAQAALIDSPWAKRVTPLRVRDLSPDERRNGGSLTTGMGKGVGLAGIGMFGAQREAAALAKAHAKAAPNPVLIRWESAPMRAAEAIASETVPAVDERYYAVVVYGVDLPKRGNLEYEMKSAAALKRWGKKDLKPSRVEILHGEDGLATVAYLFRRSVEITRKDRSVQFVAQMDRLYVEQVFHVQEMILAGRLEL
jgi:hypothetical protein